MRVFWVLAALLTLSTTGCLRTADAWFFKVLAPGDFDPALAPPAPNYEQDAAWAALPWLEDGADVFIDALPPAETPKGSVFYVHPTTWVGRAWNGPIDDEAVIEATDIGGTRIQASAFNGCCEIWAPRYRQAHGRAYIEPDAEGDLAADIAYGDILAAFEHFRQKTEGPIIVASHSQGSILAARLVKERIVGSPEQNRLVAAYLIGGPIGDDIGLPICDSQETTGCIIAWNARTEGYEPNGMEFNALEPDPMGGRICVNPLTWTQAGKAGPEANPGALFFDMDTPRILPDFVGAHCEGGALIITEPGDMERDVAGRALLKVMGVGNYHSVEYQLFYLSLRQNAQARLDAFLSSL